MNLHQFQHSEDSSRPHFLLLGNPVAHSLSPLMHNLAAKHHGFDIRYHAVNLQSNELGSIAAHLNSPFFKGANITIPYKQMLLDYVDQLDNVSQNFGAINTIVKEQEQLVGYNTDVYGFSVPLQPFEDQIAESRAIVFGTGGASRAIVYALREMDVPEVVLVSRNPDKTDSYPEYGNIYVESYEAWPALSEEACLIVNATPLGMEPDTDASPVHETETDLLSEKICYDIVYKPLKTKFLKQAESAGARTIGGLEMLIEQGSRSFEFWTGKPFPSQKIRQRLYEYFGE